MDIILALQKELGSVRGLPEDMVYVKNALIILKEARKDQAAQHTPYVTLLESEPIFDRDGELIGTRSVEINNTQSGRA